ncbi:hypothetical protein Dsin_022065 [Dipteronia sinensis]|uniref:RNase H type-1 domain-containing protein n=1 Tax=Dipteronia sinensis TaxID=43782 RepID=A0AAE0A1A5_9ROSI|nr:hypothetical protein Dsin_022065 [Dipteronia sinensis]
MWTFNSEPCREDFIDKRFLWEDSFSSMVRWSDSLVPQSRIAWVTCWGIPLPCWNPYFFMKLGWQIGEPLWVEEETRNRSRMDNGRVLVLVPQGKFCSTRVKVYVGKKSFVIKIMEEGNLVETSWLENHLALRKARPGRSSGNCVRKRKISNWTTKGARKGRPDQRKYKVGKSNQKKSGQPVNHVSFQQGAQALLVKGGIDKGKMRWVRKARDKPIMVVLQKGKLDLEKITGSSRGGVRYVGDSSSSTDEEVGHQLFLDSLKEKGGDFNAVLDPAERKGEGCNMGSIRNFNYFVSNSEVVDIPLSRASFTWSNNREKASWARLDRFLIAPEILLWFPSLFQRVLPRSLSDHNAIVIGERKEDWGPSPFRFYNDWLEEKALMQEAIEGWKGCKVKGSKGVVLSAKIQKAKVRMKSWLKANKKSTSSCKVMESDLALIDSKASKEGWTKSLREDLFSRIFGRKLRKEEQCWRQKSRVRWLKEGDMNSKFFHFVANGRKRVEYLINSRWILRCFELASGLRINFHKSCVVKVGKKSEVVEDWAGIFKCKKANLPITYLGMPLGARPLSKAFWKSLVLRMESRLAPWKKKFLSKGGRLVLIKSVLSSISTYYMSVFKVPVSVAQAMERLQRSFFWGDGVERRKVHAVDWGTICKRKSQGGLGIGRVLDKNKMGSLFIEGSLTANILEGGLKIQVGCGDRICFWEDVWWEDSPLKMVHPRIYALASKKSGTVMDFGVWQGEKWNWNVHLRRRVFDWEVNLWKAFLMSLECIVVSKDISDSVAWLHCPNGEFLVKSFRRCIEDSFDVDPKDSAFSWEGITPPKAIVWYIWEARNVVVFKGIPADVNYFTDLIKFRVSVVVQTLRERGDPGRAGIGGVLRDSSRKVLCQFSIFMGYLDVEAAEIVAIQKVVNLCASKPSFSGRKIEVVSDSKAAVAWVNEAGFGNIKLIEAIYDIRSKLVLLGNTKVIYNSRVSNDYADSLAKRGSASNGEYISWGDI